MPHPHPARISLFQLTSIGICFLMNMLDGMNVMVMSYTAPALMRAWEIPSETMGVVFSAGLLGMALGAILISPQADRFGRRTLIMCCAALMGLSVLATGWVSSLPWLIFLRILSGLGIGGMLASTATLAAEYAPRRTQDFWVSLVMGGYPLGAVLSGMWAAPAIPVLGWEVAFRGAGILTLATIPLTAWLLSESPAFLLQAQPPKALIRLNHIRMRMHEAPLDSLPEQAPAAIKTVPVLTLLAGPMQRSTLLLWTGLFMAFATLYFLTSWIPRLADTVGLPMQMAIYAGTVFNLGAFGGILLQGYLSGRLGLRRTLAGFLFTTAGLMGIFGLISGSIWVLVLFGLIGLGIQGGFVGLYSVAARLYPVSIRTTGVGWAIGLGRVGGIVGPMLGGILMGQSFSPTVQFMFFALPLFISGWATLVIMSAEVP
ncbi:MAG: MFS transporter [Bacteroidia bacterium]|nr:MFS transporter [Bacteroidia bacterium]